MRPSRIRRDLRWRGVHKGWMKRELARLYGLRCALCREPKTRKELVMDHIFPWSRGGSSTLENLQLLCQPCNEAKGDQ